MLLAELCGRHAVFLLKAGAEVGEIPISYQLADPIQRDIASQQQIDSLAHTVIVQIGHGTYTQKP